MKKKFMKVALFGVLTLTAGASFVGCKDYDDDISGLNEALAATKSDLTSKEAALKASIASLEAAKVDVAAVLASAKTESDKAALKAKEDAIASSLASMKAIEADLKAKIAANTSDIQTLNEQVLAADKAFAALSGEVAQIQKMLLGYEGLVETVGKLQSADTRLETEITTLSDSMKKSIEDLQGQITAVTTQIGALGEGETVAGELGKLLDELNAQKKTLDKAATKEELAAANDLIAGNTKKIQELSTKIDGQLNVLKSLFRSLVTNIGFVETVAPFNLVVATIPAGTSAFGGTLEGAFKFEKGVYTSASKMLIQVSPSTANISAEALTLVRTDGESLSSDLVTLEVQPYNEALTRGESKGGIWEVSVKLNPTYDKAAFDKLVKKDANSSYRFAVALKDAGTEAEGGERIIASPYELTFPKNGDYTAMTSIGESTVGTTKLTTDDLKIPIEIGTPVNVKAIGDEAGVYASYITLEETDPAKLALLATYGITGYNKVNRTTNEFVLNVANAAADGKEIKFKLWTIDVLGTTKLEKTFTLSCGKKNTGNPELKATLAPVANQSSAIYDMPKAVAMTTVLAANDADAKNLVGSNLTVELKDAAGAAITGVSATLYKKDLTTTVAIATADYKAIKEVAAVQLKGINLQQIADNGSVAGKLMFKNTAGLELLSVPVTLTKTMPTFPTTFSAKSGILANGIIKVYPTFVSGAKATYEYTKIFNGVNATDNTNYVFNYMNPDVATNADAKAGNVEFNNDVTKPYTQIGVANKLVGSQGHTIATAVTYDFGSISSVKKESAFVSFLTTWNTPFALQFASIPEESKMTVKAFEIAYPAASYVLAIKGNVTYTNIVDGTQLALAKEGDIKDIKVKTVSGNGVENEYYTPSIATVDGSAVDPAKPDGAKTHLKGDILFAKKSDLAALSVDVDSKLVFTIEDVFGNKFERSFDFKVKKNQ